jgi:glycosyltransferase involved in cell wall biosynthesis
VRAAVSRPEDRRLKRRLLSIGHSYVVAQNRRLAHEMAVQGGGDWDVTAAGPATLQGDLREIQFEPIAGEASTPVPLDVRFGGHPHLRIYGRGLRSLLRQPWDVVHCWEEPYVLAAAQVARHLQDGVRFVPATFQNIAKQYPAPVAWNERRVMARADGWIAFAESVYDVQRNRPGYSSKPARVISPGVDVDVFRPDSAGRRLVRERIGLSPGDLVAGFIGRFVEEKGVTTLLDAVDRSTTPWHLLFVGGGPLLAAIERARTRHPSRVHLVTNVPHDDVSAHLNAMDLMCAPSRTTPRWREQFGRMLIEAMACGVPVLASRSGEIPHVLAEAGVLVAEDDTASWTAEIARLLGDAAVRRDLSGRGIERARTRFAWPVIARAHLDFFEELCAR